MRPISLGRDGSVVTATFSSPILERRLLTALADTIDAFAATDPAPAVVLASAHPTIYLAGAHLAEIAELDAESCIAYAHLGRSLAARLESYPAPVVAAVHGSCSGGGFDLVMACDAVIASPDATFSHPGVLRGLVTGWGGSIRLAGHLGSGALRKALLEGSPIDASSMAEWGAIRGVASDPLSQGRQAARDLAALHPSRLRAWRLLKGPCFIDRFRAFVVEK